MRFMIFVRTMENGAPNHSRPGYERGMEHFRDHLVSAGVLLAAEGLCPSAFGARLTFADGKHQVIEGPFPSTTDLIASFWLIQARSREEAIEWAKRIPRSTVGEGTVEVRQVFEPSAPAWSPAACVEVSHAGSSRPHGEIAG